MTVWVVLARWSNEWLGVYDNLDAATAAARDNQAWVVETDVASTFPHVWPERLNIVWDPDTAEH